MVAITAAWAILGNAERRAAYELQALKTQSRRATDRRSSASAMGQGANGTGTSPDRTGSGTVIDFGRYAGWTVGSLANHDPDYLEWLVRTQTGRRLTAEIEAALAGRASQAAALRPSPQSAKRGRSVWRPWAAAGSGSR